MNFPPYLGFSTFFFVQTLSRGLLLSVIPLQAFKVMADVQTVSALFFTVSMGGIVAALTVPVVIRAIGRYLTFILSSVIMLISLVTLTFLSPWVFTAGLFLHIFAIAAAEVTLSLYVLDLVPRRSLLRFEPWRMLFSITAMTIGPFLGVYLQTRVNHNAPYIVGIVAVLVTLIYFHALGLKNAAHQPRFNSTTNPLHHIGRFFSQPRLRLAYGLTLARSSWWAMFVIYVPIYAKQSGLGELTGAAIVSVGTAWTLTVPFWGWVGRRFGMRYLMQGAFFVTSVFSALVFVFAGQPVTASYLLILGALGASMLDGVGNVLYLRAVRTFERSEMTAVFATYRDLAQLVTPGLFAVMLKYFPFPVMFLSAGVWTLAASWFCRYIPRGMR